MDLIISLESTCDLPKEIIDKYDFKVIGMDFLIDGKVYNSEIDTVLSTNLYSKMKEGSKTSTSQINDEKYLSFFKALSSLNKPVLHLGFTSGLSGTVLAAKRAAEEVNKESSNKIIVVDTLCACSGHGYMAMLVADFAKNASSIEQVVDFAENIKLKLKHCFTVDKLKYLVNGGRVKASTAMIGNLLNIKPILRVDDEGHLVSVSKVISRKKSLNHLADECASTIDNNYKYLIISHADCLEDAKTVEIAVKEQKPDIEVLITDLGAVIGSHAGPGTIALFYVGEKR